MESVLIIFLFVCSQSGLATDVQLASLLKMQHGIGWPYSLHIMEGHEALLKLNLTVDNLQSCVVTTPGGISFDVRNPPSNRFQSWSENCGVRIQNIVLSDEGRWRLTATGTTELTGWTELYVEENISSYSAPSISLLDGETHKEIELTSLNNSYCLITQPFSDSSLVSGHCSMILDRANRAVQGNWNVLVGIPGKVTELHVERRVNVDAERLDIGFIRNTNTNKLHIYCNILYSVKNITFCRFQKTTASSGYNVRDGLSDGSHSYFGDGFAARHCGMTIEHPTAQDVGTWRCSVGVQQWVDDHIVQQTPLQALVSVTAYGGYTTDEIRRNVRDSNEEKVVLVQDGMSFTITCQSEQSLRYCWFQHPNGSQFTPVQQSSSEQTFWYAGESLQTGDCGITFSHVTVEDAGRWTCHMGPFSHQGIEVTDSVTVRVTGPLAAYNPEVGTYVGGTATLYCKTSNGNRPLNYCRFLSPTYVGISIDSTVTKDIAILGRYYFTPDRDLDHGDCSLNIDPVHSDDIGEWTCAAVVDDMTAESRDTVVVYNGGGRAPLSEAGIIGMVIGLTLLIVILISVVLYKRGYIKIPWRIRNESTQGPMERTDIRMSDFSLSTSSSQDITEFENTTSYFRN